MNRKIERIKNGRLFLLNQISGLTTEQLNKIPKDFNNNVVWNLAHLISAQQRICYVRAQLPIAIDDKYFSPYQPNTKPELFFDNHEVEVIKKLFITSIERLQSDLDKNLFGNYASWMAKPYGFEVTNIDDAIDFLLYHDGLHAGYIISLKHVL